MMSGLPVNGILQKTGLKKLPSSITTYVFCCPNLDFNFRCMPRDGGLYDQFYRDILEFNIIEGRIKSYFARNRN